jgi:uncharacterized membrane protein
MKHQEFINQLDEKRIVGAIAAAEKKTTGEVRVYVSHKERHDAMGAARKRFEELGMLGTKQRNAVLIYIVPRTRQVAVLGDVGIHAKCGEPLWAKVARGMAQRMKEGHFTEAVVEAIREVGEVLQQHFPGTHDDTNELSNEIARD